MQVFLNKVHIALGALPASFLLSFTPIVSAQGGSGVDLIHEIHGTTASRWLGFTIADAGDVDGDGYADILAGDNESGLMLNTGSAYVFSGQTGSLLHHFMSVGSMGPTDHFASALSKAGDVDGDGLDDILVGASSALVPGINPGNFRLAGSVLVYSGASGALLYKLDGPVYDANFGISVAAAGDINNDGFDDFIIGATGVGQSGSLPTGAAYVYSGATGAVLYRFDGVGSGDGFGKSVANAGDVDGDNVPDIIVGAPYADRQGMTAVGSSYVYSGATGLLLYQFDGLNPHDLFGYSVAGAGDLNNDGFGDFIVGAQYASPNGRMYAGSVYVYSGVSGSLLYQYDGQSAHIHLGSGITGGDDFDGDGLPDFAVGVGNADPNQVDGTGSFTIYSGMTGGIIYKGFGVAGDDFYGGALSCTADVNADGKADLILSASGADPNGVNGAGAIYAYSFANFDPYLTSSVPNISSAQGGQVVFSVNFPQAAAGLTYGLVAAFNNENPVVINGVSIPISPDNLFNVMRSSPPAIFNQPSGILNANGDATCTATIPAGWLSSFIGRRVFFAAAALTPGTSLDYSSVGVSLDVLP